MFRGSVGSKFAATIEDEIRNRPDQCTHIVTVELFRTFKPVKQPGVIQ